MGRRENVSEIKQLLWKTKDEIIDNPVVSTGAEVSAIRNLYPHIIEEIAKYLLLEKMNGLRENTSNFR